MMSRHHIPVVNSLLRCCGYILTQSQLKTRGQCSTVLQTTAALLCIGTALAQDNLPLQLELVPQTGHVELVCSSALNADGTQLLTGSYDHTAILWDVASGQVLRVYRGHRNGVQAVAFGRDGSSVVTAANDLIVSELATGEELLRKDLGLYGYPDLDRLEHAVAAGSFTQGGALIDTATGRVTRQFAMPHSDRAEDASLSPDGRYVLFTGHSRNRNGPIDKHDVVYVWNCGSGRLMSSLDHQAPVTDAFFLRDGNRVVTVTGKRDGNFVKGPTIVTVWDFQSGQKIERSWKSYLAQKVCPTPDGRFLVVDVDGEGLEFVSTATLRTSRTLNGDLGSTYCISANGNRLFTGREVIDTATGAVQMTLTDTALSQSGGLAFSPDGERVLIGRAVFDSKTGIPVHQITLANELIGADGFRWTLDGQRLWSRRDDFLTVLELKSGGHVLTSRIALPNADDDSEVSLNADASRVLVRDKANDGTGTGQAIIELRSDRVIQRFNEPTGVLSPDGRLAIFSREGRDTSAAKRDQWRVANIYDVNSGRLVHELTIEIPDYFPVLSNREIAVSADGNVVVDARSGRLVSGRQRILMTAWNLHSGALLARWYGHPGTTHIHSMSVTHNGSRVVTAAADGKTSVWDVNTGREVFRTSLHSQGEPAISYDGRSLLTHSGSSVGLWDVDSGNQQIATMVFTTSDDNDVAEHHWLIVTPHGLFDGSTFARKALSFRVRGGLQVIPVDRFFQDFYRPGLLAAVWRGEEPMPSTTFGTKHAPTVTLVGPPMPDTSTEPFIELEALVTNQGGGIKRPWVLHNGARVIVPGETTRQETTLRQTFEVALVEGRNEIEVFSASEDGSWESEPARVVLNYEKPLAKPTLHLVAVGVSEYAEETMNLKFAADDAQSIASMFAGRGPALYGEDNVQITEVSNSEATRAGILDAIEGVAKQAQPQDTFVLFLAGHGTMVGQRYYFLPHDFRNEADRIEDDIRSQGLPGDELNDAIGTVPALKRVMIYDTCQSGGAVALTRTARNPFAFRGALERMSRATGSFIIAATASSADAHEIEDLKHGVLSYTLLAGAGADIIGPLKNQRIAPGEKQTLDVRDWFNYAQDKVPNITKLYLGQEQFVEANVSGNNFPILPFQVD